MIKIQKTTMTGKVLLQLKDGSLVVYRKGKLIVYKQELPVLILPLPLPLWKEVCCKSRLFERALHIDVRWALDLSEKEVLFQFQDAIYLANLEKKTIEIDFDGFRGHPFSATRLNDSILIGDYGSNENRESVNIYERKDGKWQAVFSFPAGTVRHIHNIIPSDTLHIVYVLTGDEDNESGIWRINLDSKKVERVLVGKQQYRCCQMFLDNGSLCYMTDAPSEANWFYKYDGKKINPISEIPGTAIYGVQVENGFLFSTTVEPDAHIDNRFRYWLTSKPGVGIKSNYTKVLYVKSNEMEEIASFPHDRMPLHLFQYATVYFSNYIKPIVYFTPYSVRGYDDTIFKGICVDPKEELK